MRIEKSFIIAVVCIALIISTINYTETQRQSIFPMNKKVTITTHRGAAGLAPENTLVAIREGMKYADRIEIDVHQSKDGKIVVMHDASVNRTTNGKGKIKDLSWDYLSQLDAGSWFSPKYEGEKIPLLEEVIDMVCPEKILLIEVKEGEYPNIEKNITRIIKEKGVEDRVIIQSFSTKILETFHKINPEIRLHKLFAKQIYLFGFPITFVQAPSLFHTVTLFYLKKYPYIQEFSIFHRFFSKRFIEKLDRQTGEKHINVWVENNPQRARKLIQLGVDGIITDYPNRFTFLKEKTSPR